MPAPSTPAALTYKQVEVLAMSLPPQERYRLAERLLGFEHANNLPDLEERVDWMDLAGAAPGHLGGIDAQEWINRIRNGEDLDTPARSEAKS